MRFTPTILLGLGLVAASPARPQAWGPQSWGETVRRAKNIAPEQPQSQWEQQIDGVLAADMIEFVSPDRVLVGLVRTTRLGEPRYADVALVNAADGSILWQTERDQIGQGNYSLLGTSPLLLLLGSNDVGGFLSGVDPASGKRFWQYRAPNPFSIVRPAPDRILVLSKQGSGRRLEALDAATGRSLWKAEFDKKAIPDSADVRLFFAGDTAIIVAGQITEIDAKSGATLRTIARAAPSDNLSAQLDGSVVLVWSGQNVELLDVLTTPHEHDSAIELRAQVVGRRRAGDGAQRGARLRIDLRDLAGHDDGRIAREEEPDVGGVGNRLLIELCFPQRAAGRGIERFEAASRALLREDEDPIGRGADDREGVGRAVLPEAFAAGRIDA